MANPLQTLFNYIDLHTEISNSDCLILKSKFVVDPNSLTQTEIQAISDIVINHMYIDGILTKGLLASPTNELLLLVKEEFDKYGFINPHFYPFVENYNLYV